MVYGTEEFRDFKKFLKVIGFQELKLTKNPYEAYRGERKLPDGSRDLVVLYKKSSGLISFQNKDIGLRDEFELYKERQAKKVEEKSYKNFDDYWAEAEKFVPRIQNCDTREEKLEILSEVLSLQVARRLVVLLSETF